MKLSHSLLILGAICLATDLYTNQIAGIDRWAKSQNGDFVLFPRLKKSRFAILLVPFALIIGFGAGYVAIAALIYLWLMVIDAFHYIISGFSLSAAHHYLEVTAERNEKPSTFSYIGVGVIMPVLLGLPLTLALVSVAFMCIGFCLETPFRSLVNLSQAYTFKRVLLVVGLVLTIWGTLTD
jgi:hypothetical protein